MVCKKCGELLPSTAVFCDQCGEPQVEDAEQRKAAWLARPEAAGVPTVPETVCQHEADAKAGQNFCQSCGEKLN